MAANTWMYVCVCVCVCVCVYVCMCVLWWWRRGHTTWGYCTTTTRKTSLHVYGKIRIVVMTTVACYGVEDDEYITYIDTAR